jgi:hypothetical protein
MEKKENRKKGGQPGNRNAIKHGFYSKTLTDAEQNDFEKAAGIEGIDEEIALIRLEIKRALTGGDDTNLKIIVRATNALEKLIRTRYQISAAQRQGLKEAIGNVIRDIIIPLGINVSTAVLTKKLSG